MNELWKGYCNALPRSHISAGTPTTTKQCPAFFYSSPAILRSFLILFYLFFCGTRPCFCVCIYIVVEFVFSPFSIFRCCCFVFRFNLFIFFSASPWPISPQSVSIWMIRKLRRLFCILGNTVFGSTFRRRPRHSYAKPHDVDDCRLSNVNW